MHNLTQAASHSQLYDNNSNKSSKPRLPSKQHKSPIGSHKLHASTDRPNHNYMNPTRSIVDQSSVPDASLVPARFNSIDNISKKLSTIAKINSISDISESKMSPTNTLQTLAKSPNKDHLNNSKENLAKQPSNTRPIADNAFKMNTSQHTSASNNLDKPSLGSEAHVRQPAGVHHTPSNSSVYMPPCPSNGISNELRQKLRENILRKQDKNYNNRFVTRQYSTEPFRFFLSVRG
jgi:hypothetical protein